MISSGIDPSYHVGGKSGRLALIVAVRPGPDNPRTSDLLAPSGQIRHSPHPDQPENRAQYMTDGRVYFFDTTLRDGAQTQGIDFTPVDKEFIARELDRVGIDYIEGGWPGATPTDDAFFNNLPRPKRS